MSYEFVSVSCFPSDKNFTSKSCRDSLRASSSGNFRGWGREEWEDRPGELARACVASHAEVRHAFLPHEGGKDCVTRQKSA